MVRMSSLCQFPMLTQVVDVDYGSVNTDEVMERLFHLTSRVAEYLSVVCTSFTFVCQQFQYGQQGNKSVKLCPKPLKTVTLRYMLS